MHPSNNYEDVPPRNRIRTKPEMLSIQANNVSDIDIPLSANLTNGNYTPSNYQAIEDVLQALVAYTVPPSAATSWSGTRSEDSNNKNPTSPNHLTCLFDSHNLAKVGLNKNVERSFIQDRGVSRINDYQGLIFDNKQRMIMAMCCLSTCNSKVPLFEARKRFKSCHHCYTYYCSPQCRQQDWVAHKMTMCPIGRTVSAAKSVIKKLLSDESVHNMFSNLGRGGYLRMGRGCIVVWFPCCSDAEKFAKYGTGHLLNYPVFVCIKNIHILRSRFVPNSLSAIHEACNTYDPEKSIVVNISIAIDDHLLKMCSAKMRHATVHAVKKCVTVSLSSIFLNSLATKEQFDELRPTSLLLTMLPNQTHCDKLDYKDRQLIFINILRQLQSREVNLKEQYPALYRNLVRFVEDNVEFPPTTIYPTEVSSGRAFVCMIAPQTDPICSLAQYNNAPSNRSSVGSFMAELEAMTPDWEKCDITDL